MGDSLTAGYGVDPDEAYPVVVAAGLKEQGVAARVINGGVSGETTAGGRTRIGWLMKQQVDVLVLALGANDGLRGVAPEASAKNLSAIIELAREANPRIKILLAGMKVPPNMGAEFSKKFEAIFAEIAKEDEVAFLPFLLEGVGGVDAMNLADGIHPNAAGQRAIAALVLPKLLPLLGRAE